MTAAREAPHATTIEHVPAPSARIGVRARQSTSGRARRRDGANVVIVRGSRANLPAAFLHCRRRIGRKYQQRRTEQNRDKSSDQRNLGHDPTDPTRRCSFLCGAVAGWIGCEYKESGAVALASGRRCPSGDSAAMIGRTRGNLPVGRGCPRLTSASLTEPVPGTELLRHKLSLPQRCARDGRLSAQRPTFRSLRRQNRCG